MILDDFKLDGRVALVTGAGRGLGQGMALALAEAGADLVLIGASAPPEHTAYQVRAMGRRAMTLVCDLGVATVNDLNQLIDHTVEEFGIIDILINNAGIIRRTPVLDFAESDWDDVIRVNQKALFFLAQAAGRVMARQGYGRIINTASLLSCQGGINVVSYTASKHAVAGITKALANELAPKGVCVNAIVPGYFATDNTAALREDGTRSASILERIPAGRWGEPRDLAGAAVFLASPAAAYVHGTTIAVDGGWLAR